LRARVLSRRFFYCSIHLRVLHSCPTRRSSDLVLEVGVITTPGLSYLVRAQDADAGVQISASHNPVEDNGIKFFGSDGLKLSDAKDRKSTRLNSSHVSRSYAVFCLKKKK